MEVTLKPVDYISHHSPPSVLEALISTLAGPSVVPSVADVSHEEEERLKEPPSDVCLVSPLVRLPPA